MCVYTTNRDGVLGNSQTYPRVITILLREPHTQDFNQQYVYENETWILVYTRIVGNGLQCCNYIALQCDLSFSLSLSPHLDHPYMYNVLNICRATSLLNNAIGFEHVIERAKAFPYSFNRMLHGDQLIVSFSFHRRRRRCCWCCRCFVIIVTEQRNVSVV